MWLISVTPISRGINKERLYYFSSEQFEEGDIIEIPVRSRSVVAKIDEIRRVTDAKAELKSLPFSIRKVSTLKTTQFFSKAFMKAADETATYFAGTLGATLHSLLPPKRLISALNFSMVETDVKPAESGHASYVLQCSDEDRMGTYRRMAREEFAGKRSIIVVLPTISEAIKTHKEIQKGVEEYAYLLHQRLAKPALSKTWQAALSSEHPIIAVTTPQFIGLPRRDVGIIALERESSRNFKRDSRPFLDYRIFARFYAKALGAKLIYADSMIRSETYNKLENGEAYEYSKASFRPLFPAQTQVFIANNKTGKSVRAIEESTMEFLKENREAGKRQFILSPRRGLAPRTICRNCGKGLLCENCGGALVLHGAKRQKPDDVTVYVCHRCGDEADSMIRCRYCASWDLIPFRIGTEQVEIELKELFPKQDIIRFDRDTIKTETDALKAMRKFEVPGSVLIGTEIAFSYLAEKIDTVLVMFPELLTSVPEYTGDENALRFILRAKSLASIKFAIQTAEPELPIIKWSENANLADFYRREIELRQSLNYPPFGTLVLITYAKNAAIQKQIEATFAAYQPTFFEGMGESKEERVFFRMQNKNWPDAKFRELCLSLPQNCAIEVMPERLFS